MYRGPLDGIRGPATVRALLVLQHRTGIAATGRLDRRTRRALGRLGRHLPATRTLSVGDVGWDVSWLEFLLARRGFDPGPIDGRFDRRTKVAVVSFARFAGIADRCHAHPGLIRALRHSRTQRSPLRLAWPVRGTVSARFGIQGARLHRGVELAAPFGVGVAAAFDGRVVFAGRQRSLGLAIVLRHPRGVVTVYGHLGRIDVHLGDAIARGALIGVIGKTGRTHGSGLYFELRVRGAAIDPLRALS